MNTRERHKKFREELRSHIVTKRTITDRAADILTIQFGTIWFFALNAVFFIFWIAANEGMLGIEPFDPYPFNFLTMVVSLEAIFLSIIVLISQNRQSRVADMREQIDFEVNVRAKEEITKNLIILERIAKAMHIPLEYDKELKEMQTPTDIKQIQRQVEEDAEGK